MGFVQVGNSTSNIYFTWFILFTCSSHTLHTIFTHILLVVIMLKKKCIYCKSQDTKLRNGEMDFEIEITQQHCSNRLQSVLKADILMR